jgi:hypothetical protein
LFALSSISAHAWNADWTARDCILPSDPLAGTRKSCRRAAMQNWYDVPMNSRAPRNVVVLVVDRLHRGFLGAYGNSWIQTPAFDRLAAEGFLFDSTVIDSPELDRQYRSYWQGWHALAQQTEASRSQPAMGRQLSDSGYSTILLTDEARLMEHPSAGGFQRRQLLARPNEREEIRIADAVEKTYLGAFFRVACEELTAATAPCCLWLHAGLLDHIWDAPLELAEQYRDEDDPRAIPSADVPDRWLPRDFDPDELLTIVHTYAGQVSLLDLFLGELLDCLARHPAAASTLLAVTSTRGFPLGEHLRVGRCDEALYSELTHVPLLVLMADGCGASDRTQSLVQPPDLHATILDWCGQPTNAAASSAQGKSLLPLVRGNLESVRDRACISGLSGERAIITPAWSVRLAGKAGNESTVEGERDSPAERASGAQAAPELFAKPDDWFEANEVGNRCQEVLGELKEALAQFEQASEGSEAVQLPELPADLVVGGE